MKHSLSTPAGTSSFRTPPDYPLNQRRRPLSVVLVLAVLVFGTSSAASAADRYVRAGATGSTNGTDWTNAYTDIPSSLTRGDTYYVADGTYSSPTFDDPTSGTLVITIKKATIADHGTNTGWDNSYGDGQALLGSRLSFATSYYTLDGNGTHTIPSDNTNDYGFRVSGSGLTNTDGVVRIGTNSPVSYITVRYLHAFNLENSSTSDNCTVLVRFHVSYKSTYIKFQNSFFENSGKDGIQISTSSLILFERSYFKNLGKLLSSAGCHGQTIQLFYGGDDIIFRWNYFDANEGQALFSLAAISPIERIRFYGNVVFNKLGQIPQYGFNVSGGIVGDISDPPEVGPRDLYIYNNSIINVGGDYTGSSGFKLDAQNGNVYVYNNLAYNVQGDVSDPNEWTGFGYNAYGGGEGFGGTNEQSGLTSSIFTNYAANNFTLASGTATGLRLTSQPWWQGGADSFFGQVDSDADILGNVRGEDGTWDRGAFEFTGAITPRPAAPTGLTVN